MDSSGTLEESLLDGSQDFALQGSAGFSTKIEPAGDEHIPHFFGLKANPGDPKWKLHLITGLNITFLFVSLYFFLVGLEIMGTAFQVVGGKSAGGLFTAVDNPLSGLVVGIVATSLVQSSSTSTSIVVGLVATGLIRTQQAIPIIMGANIGTTLTNTVVALGQANDLAAYERAFAAAVIDDVFNVFSVGVLFPIEVICGYVFGGGPIYLIADTITAAILGGDGVNNFDSPLDFFLDPLVDLVITADRSVLNALSLGIPTLETCFGTEDNPTFEAGVNFHVCGDPEVLVTSLLQWEENVEQGVVLSGGMFQSFSDVAAGLCGLVISLILLIGGLTLLVSQLKSLLLGSASSMAAKVSKWSAWITVPLGCLVTLAVQSSTVTTSTLTPMVGVGLIPLETMYALAAGANVGTTGTAILAGLVSGNEEAIEVGLCHFIFNFFGVLLWYPAMKMRLMVLNTSYRLAYVTVAYSYFPAVYISVGFIFLPLYLMGVSVLIDDGSAETVIPGVFLLILLFSGVGALAFWYLKRGGKEWCDDKLTARRLVALQNTAGDLMVGGDRVSARASGIATFAANHSMSLNA